jgi:hypothetical protein
MVFELVRALALALRCRNVRAKKRTAKDRTGSNGVVHL